MGPGGTETSVNTCVCVCVYTHSIWDDNAYPESHRLSNKNTKIKPKEPPFELLVKVIQETSKTIGYSCFRLLPARN